MAERVRLRIGNMAKAVLVTGQAYQDPKDALNEFVSNAADEYAQAERPGDRITIRLRRRGRYPMIAVDDDGRGMPPDRLREVARNLFESTKAGDDRVLGEKAIGLLAFQQLGERCEIVSRAEDSDETWALRLARGKASAVLDREKRRARDAPGTTVYLADLDPDVLRMLTQRKVVDYLRSRRGPALAAGAYEIEVVEGRRSELVTAERPDGVKLALPARSTLWGRIEFALYVGPAPDPDRHVAVVGRAGTTIIDDIATLDEFADIPWTGRQVAGQIVFPALHQSAGRRAILRDRDAFPVFVDAVRAVEPVVARTIERVTQEVDAETADRLADVVRKVLGRVLKELDDLESPLRTPVGSEPGDGALFEPQPDGSQPPDEPDARGPTEPPRPPVVDAGEAQPQPDETPSATASPDRRRSTGLPSLAVDPDPGDQRSRFDPDEHTVLYNDRHPDYLLVKDDEAALLDYLATLVAKEIVVFNNARAEPPELAEEIVRMLVRVRRHIPKRF